jgi:hypothetical protein
MFALSLVSAALDDAPELGEAAGPAIGHEPAWSLGGRLARGAQPTAARTSNRAHIREGRRGDLSGGTKTCEAPIVRASDSDMKDAGARLVGHEPDVDFRGARGADRRTAPSARPPRRATTGARPVT